MGGKEGVREVSLLASREVDSGHVDSECVNGLALLCFFSRHPSRCCRGCSGVLVMRRRWCYC